mgnify:FL=1|jgi:hypothetical protein
MKSFNLILPLLIFWSGITLTNSSNFCGSKVCCCVQGEDQSCCKMETIPCTCFHPINNTQPLDVPIQSNNNIIPKQHLYWVGITDITFESNVFTSATVGAPDPPGYYLLNSITLPLLN